MRDATMLPSTGFPFFWFPNWKPWIQSILVTVVSDCYQEFNCNPKCELL